MRIYFPSMTIPNRSVERVKQFFSPDALEPMRHMCIADAQSIVAGMLGYLSWNELREVTEVGSFAPSPMDEVISTQELDDRIRFQMERFESLSSGFPVRSPYGLELMKLILRLQVTSTSGTNTSYYDYSHNRFHSFDNQGIYYLMRSQRTIDSTDEIAAIEKLDILAAKKTFLFREALLRHPEDLNAVAYLLGLTYHYDLSINSSELARFHELFRGIIPAHLLTTQKNWIQWDLDTRDLILSMLSIGFIFCRTGYYERGFRWLWVASNSCDVISSSLEAGLKENNLLSKYNSWTRTVNELGTYSDFVG